MPPAKFLAAFVDCAQKQLRKRHGPAATSFLRSDLPIKTYGDGFGYMIRAPLRRVACAYAFDAYRGWGMRSPCSRPAAELVRIRQRVQRAFSTPHLITHMLATEYLLPVSQCAWQSSPFTTNYS